MKYWLVKSEPNAWSWDEHVTAGIAEWDGVRSHQACNNMKAMKIGDRAFFYHSIKEKQVVGILEVAKEYYHCFPYFMVLPADGSDITNRTVAVS